MTRLALLLAILLPVVGAGRSDAHIGSHEVAVRDNFYDPQLLAIDKGETVTWRAVNGGHTATADDGSFDLPRSGTLAVGETVTWTAPNRDVTIKYRCRVHSSMVGILQVGAGTVVEPPPPPPVEVRSVPSSRYPTIGSATVVLADRVRIEIAPGTYPEAIVLSAATLQDPHLEVVGMGENPGDVVIDGGGTRNTGIGVLVDGVVIRNLRVQGFTSTGVLVRDVARFAIQNVEAIGNGQYGIRTLRAAEGRIVGVTASGAARAGIAVQGCTFCDVLVDTAHAGDNLFGFAASDAGSLTVRRSLFEGNGVGIALRNSLGAGAVARGATHVFDNTILDSTSGRHRGTLETMDWPVHAGIWLDAGRFATIERNVVGGGVWGVLVTGFAGPSVGNRIAGNVLADFERAHLAWDGNGASTCFAANEPADRDELETHPPALEDLQPCGRATVGTPYPVVNALVLAGPSAPTP